MAALQAHIRIPIPSRHFAAMVIVCFFATACSREAPETADTAAPQAPPATVSGVQPQAPPSTSEAELPF